MHAHSYADVASSACVRTCRCLCLHACTHALRSPRLGLSAFSPPSVNLSTLKMLWPMIPMTLPSPGENEHCMRQCGMRVVASVRMCVHTNARTIPCALCSVCSCLCMLRQARVRVWRIPAACRCGKRPCPSTCNVCAHPHVSCSTHAGDWQALLVGGLNGGCHFGLLPDPQNQVPFWSPSLGQQQLAIWAERHADILLRAWKEQARCELHTCEMQAWPIGSATSAMQLRPGKHARTSANPCKLPYLRASVRAHQDLAPLERLEVVDGDHGLLRPLCHR